MQINIFLLTGFVVNEALFILSVAALFWFYEEATGVIIGAHILGLVFMFMFAVDDTLIFWTGLIIWVAVTAASFVLALRCLITKAVCNRIAG